MQRTSFIDISIIDMSIICSFSIVSTLFIVRIAPQSVRDAVSWATQNPCLRHIPNQIVEGVFGISGSA
jgi:hypothetical protein